MTKTSKTLLALSLLSAFAACGGDDSGNTTADAGGIIVRPADSGTASPDAGNVVITPTNDGGVSDDDAGAVTPGDCFSGTRVKMVDFLNRCSTVQTTTKTLAVPANLLTADGGVVAN